MNYTIPHERLIKLINKVFLSHYSGRLIKISGDTSEYLFFLPEDIAKNYDNRTSINLPPFERNTWGNLFINDNQIVNKIQGVFGLDFDESLELILLYFRETYGTYFKKVTVDFI